jgi:23S rRNA (guanosine2251-2'-O)-methyltransferase
MPLYLRNPHSVLAALEQRPEDVFEIRLPDRGTNDTWERVRKAARDVGTSIVAPKPARGGKRKEGGGGRSSETEAVVKERPDCDLSEVLGEGQDNTKGLWVAIDTVQDPRNLGSIFRSAAFFGVKGMVLSRDRTAPLSSITYDVASGGLEHVPFATVPNLSRTLDEAKERGLWILGASEHADTAIDDVMPDRAWMLALGNEETGLRRLTIEKCDVVFGIPSLGPIPSLNVSVAAGICIQKLTA